MLPFYSYGEDGSERRENITDWALQEFQTRYGDPTISKWDIFHYVYALLHYPQYRERYAANLRRELPSIPLVAQASAPASSGSIPAPGRTAERRRSANSQPGTAALQADASIFHALSSAGKKLAELHAGYEQQPEFSLRRRKNPSHRSTGAWKRCASPKTSPRSPTTTSSHWTASRPRPLNTVSATVPPSNG